ncbi:MAG: MBL fold metallo-hydrolase [Christensenellaceae bacterium]|nr:MBL fold metallo-hydrolase [Christensenellaceae bacterium]
MDGQTLNDQECIEIADQVYWVGFADAQTGLHCNPYLIIDGDEAVLIDSGSRDDFGTVMLKILRTGINPGQIKRLIYQHYDPDLCGNLPHMEAMINIPDIRVISHYENNLFINYYSQKSPKDCIEALGGRFAFSSGRALQFIRTPYAHTPGSFVTYDAKTGVLFSSDLFGGYDYGWSLYAQIESICERCQPHDPCPVTGGRCQLAGMLDFHRRVMPSTVALRHALSLIEGLDIRMIAPQHGSILNTPESRKAAIGQLKRLSGVGIDRFVEEGPDGSV